MVDTFTLDGFMVEDTQRRVTGGDFLHFAYVTRQSDGADFYLRDERSLAFAVARDLIPANVADAIRDAFFPDAGKA